MHEHEEEYREDNGTFTYGGGTGAFTVVWFLICIVFLLWLFIH